jgi:hypothetical protein
MDAMDDKEKRQAAAKDAMGTEIKGADDRGKPGESLKKKKQDKVSIDPAQRGFGGFDRSQLKGKAPIFRTMKKSGR